MSGTLSRVASRITSRRQLGAHVAPIDDEKCWDDGDAVYPHRLQSLAHGFPFEVASGAEPRPDMRDATTDGEAPSCSADPGGPFRAPSGNPYEIPTVRLGRRLVVPLTQLAAMLNGEQRALDGQGSDVG